MTAKVYVDVLAVFSREGDGYRYTCQVGGKICHLTYEENYKWFMERK